MPENEYRSFDGEIRLLESKNPFLFPIEVWALNDAPNRNFWQFTDMEGNRYTYTVTSLRYEQHADQTALDREASDLTLFVKNIYAFEYLIISCRA